MTGRRSRPSRTARWLPSACCMTWAQATLLPLPPCQGYTSQLPAARQAKPGALRAGTALRLAAAIPTLSGPWTDPVCSGLRTQPEAFLGHYCTCPTFPPPPINANSSPARVKVQPGAVLHLRVVSPSLCSTHRSPSLWDSTYLDLPGPLITVTAPQAGRESYASHLQSWALGATLVRWQQ